MMPGRAAVFMHSALPGDQCILAILMLQYLQLQRRHTLGSNKQGLLTCLAMPPKGDQRALAALILIVTQVKACLCRALRGRGRRRIQLVVGHLHGRAARGRRGGPLPG